MHTIILASQSPRRKSLLDQAELTFQIKTAHVNEDFPEDMEPDAVPEYIAGNKAWAVLLSLNGETKNDPLIIAADTVVIIGREIIGKPHDAEDAKNILRKLSGKMHRVVTGVVMQSMNRKVSFKDTTYVHFNNLTEAQIEHYVTKYNPMDKAGAYAIQEWIGLVGIKKIDGDFYNVMGLPVNRVIKELNSF
jgi:septum formation protein